MDTTEHKIPDAMTDAAAVAIEDLRTQVQLGLCSSKDIAEAALKSARVGELLAALENFIEDEDECSEHSPNGENCQFFYIDQRVCIRCEARAAIARAKGDA